MMLVKDKVHVGDIITYEDTWSYKPAGETGKYWRTGRVCEVYPHHVVIKTDVGYNVSVSNADLFLMNGWR